ncbi:MAG TPA: SlyX family protein [Accumulibacter sp.]|uniref:SlyX family protein n=1 Tax=Accumulibacter sp. TaxID=2053492 RepID=UPI000EBB94DC|nr:SlyX family protein [Accumulibacter sp.]HCZ17241.1 SlyX protein [Accumulibacter sp.]HRF71565.1 SlyX family protein [Accumulibacter sp.]
MEDRVSELEVRITLAEDLVEELNLTVYRQQQQIDLLQQQLRHLYRHLQEAPTTVDKSNPRDDIPPHY